MNDTALQRPAAASGTGSDLQSERLKSAWLFLAPTFLVLAMVAGWPLVRTVWFSLTDASLTNLDGAQFVGFKNYLTGSRSAAAAPSIAACWLIPHSGARF